MVFSLVCFANSTNTQKTARYFSQIKNNPEKLRKFLYKMPKGGDIHTHLIGGTYVENLVKYAKNDGFCVNPKDLTVSQKSNCQKKYQLKNITKNPTLYNRLIDAWSMRNFKPGKETWHQHCFNTFIKLAPVVENHRGEILSEMLARAAKQNEDYLEVQIDTDFMQAVALGSKIKQSNNFDLMRKALIQKGILKLVKDVQRKMNGYHQVIQKRFHGNVVLRYQYAVIRTFKPSEIFAQMLLAYELANRDPRVVGVNFASLEDHPLSLRDYDLHMRMFGYFQKLYPKVKLSPHAGELTPALVSKKYLRDHVEKVVFVAKANRIGHADDITYESNAKKTLKAIAKKHILVEENLTSNIQNLNIKPNQIPILLFLRSHIPLTLCSDDEGLFRIDLTHEYVKAAQYYNFSYPILKTFSRNSLSYAFLPGKNLWQNRNKFIPIKACSNDKLGSKTPSRSCTAFLNKSKKARLQWKLENQFNQFESTH